MHWPTTVPPRVRRTNYMSKGETVHMECLKMFLIFRHQLVSNWTCLWFLGTAGQHVSDSFPAVDTMEWLCSNLLPQKATRNNEDYITVRQWRNALWERDSDLEKTLLLSRRGTPLRDSSVVMWVVCEYTVGLWSIQASLFVPMPQCWKSDTDNYRFINQFAVVESS